MATLGLKEMGKFPWEDKENEGERNGLRGKNNKMFCLQVDSNTRPLAYQIDALTNCAIRRIVNKVVKS